MIMSVVCCHSAHAQDVSVREELEECVSSLDITPAPADSAVVADSVAWSKKNWVSQLIENGFRVKQPGINYPKFPRFCLKVYEWGDRTFNTYDKSYVQGTGKNWKLLGKSANWANSYFMIFPHNTQLHMLSDLNADVGGYLCFMAVSVGYMFNVNEFLSHTKSKRRNFSFNFTCALFSGNISKSSNTGGVTIKRFGDYMDGKTISVPLENVSNNQFSFDLYYFFNHSKYSQAAAYSYSKYQLKSAGTWLAGVAFNNQSIGLDFESLPQEMMEFLPSLSKQYNFHYTDYNVLGGYAHNWVPRPRRWLINLTVLPSIGYKHSFEDATDGRRDMFSTNLRLMTSVVYNHRSLFASLIGRLDAYLYYTKNFTFLNSTEAFSINVGMRF